MLPGQNEKKQKGPAEVMQPVMILAGGTGGHVFPALAVADELRDRGVPIIWVGTKKGIEYKVVPAAGFSLTTMNVQGLRSKGWLQYLRAPLIIAGALCASLFILLKHRPCALLGMGGFVAGPCGLIGVLLRKPLIIHEQNAIVGLTNRMLAPLSRIMFTGFPIQYKKRRLEFSGNPVRKKFTQIPAPNKRFQNRSDRKRLLMIGGSSGSAALNEVLPASISALREHIDVDVWHQTGAGNRQNVVRAYQQFDFAARVDEFITEVDQAYAWADLIICRSGAITLAEIASVGLGAVLVPYPHAVDDHQTANARRFVSAGAAYLLSQTDLSVHKLAELLSALLSDDAQLMKMACAARQLGGVNASKRVADECIQACGYFGK